MDRTFSTSQIIIQLFYPQASEHNIVHVYQSRSLCLQHDNSVVRRKLTKLEIAITGSIDVPERTLRMILMLIGVLVTATLTAP